MSEYAPAEGPSTRARVYGLVTGKARVLGIEPAPLWRLLYELFQKRTNVNIEKLAYNSGKQKLDCVAAEGLLPQLLEAALDLFGPARPAPAAAPVDSAPLLSKIEVVEEAASV